MLIAIDFGDDDDVDDNDNVDENMVFLVMKTWMIGSIPFEIGHLMELRKLHLNNNNLTGNSSIYELLQLSSPYACSNREIMKVSFLWSCFFSRIYTYWT